MEYWLHERGYSERVARQEISKAQKISRNELLEKGRNHQEEIKLTFDIKYYPAFWKTFNITYYPAFWKTKTVLAELQILLAPDKEHQKVFRNVPIAGLHNGNSLKDHLVRISIPVLNGTLDSEPCGKRNCQVCRIIVKHMKLLKLINVH